jgi:hypothetical protein
MEVDPDAAFITVAAMCEGLAIWPKSLAMSYLSDTFHLSLSPRCCDAIKFTNRWHRMGELLKAIGKAGRNQLTTS